MINDVIVALDFKNQEETLEFLKKFDNELFVKIGHELYYSEGPEIIREIKKMGHKVFLDLKLHDIPNTVYSATRSVLNLGIDIIDLHISGGSEMMKAARLAIDESEDDVMLIGITMLTSTDDEIMHKEILIDEKYDLNEAVLKYAELGLNSGLQGVVCSALEVPMLRERFGDKIVTVTPGIRPASNKGDDQKRVVTPARARELGSDYIVVGRPITQSENPVEAYFNIKKEFLGQWNKFHNIY